MAYGYRFHEVGLKCEPINKDVIVTVHSANDPSRRAPVRVSTGLHVDGFAPMEGDPNDQNTVMAGVFKRVGRVTPAPDPKMLRRLKKFVQRFVSKLTPLDPCGDYSVRTWLDNTSYPKWRKDDLWETWVRSFGILTKRDFRNKSFMKDEPYGEYKHVRNIFSRTDVWKCMLGPYMKAIETIMYKHPSFIKHVPVLDRPKYIMDMLYTVGAKYIETDYTDRKSVV